MHPVLFEIPGLGLPLHSFGLMVVLGFLLGSHLFARIGERYALDPEAEAPGYAAVPLWILVGILIGARAMYVIVEIARGSETGQAYLDDPLMVFAYWEGGLVMYGGTFGGIALGLYAARKYRLRLLHALDMGLPSGFFGLAVGRVGCLLVGDDYGKVVPESARDLPFPITIRVPEELPERSLFGDDNAGEVLWATQPWMSLNALMLGFLGYYLLRRRHYAGQVTLVMLVLYSIGRYVIESFRGDDIRGMWFDGAISTSQLVSIGLGSVALVLLVVFRNRREPRLEPGPAARPAGPGDTGDTGDA